MFKRLLILTSAILCISGLFCSGVYADEIDFPDPIGYVNDFADILTVDDSLDERLEELDKSEGTQIFIITTDTLPSGVDLDTFIPRLTDNNPEWAAGTAENDNGVIFTIVVEDRTMRIDVGYGLEGALPDLLTQHIQDDTVRPLFREGDYDGGVVAGVDLIVKAVEGEYTLENVQAEQELEDALAVAFTPIGSCLFIFMFFILPYMGSFLGRTKAWWLGGVLGGIMGLAMGAWIARFSIFGWFRYMGLGLFPAFFGGIGLLLDYVLSKNYKKRKKRGLPTTFRSSWGGFSSGSSSSSGGSSFSGGGGGSFGGGGSSSSW